MENLNLYDVYILEHFAPNIIDDYLKQSCKKYEKIGNNKFKIYLDSAESVFKISDGMLKFYGKQLGESHFHVSISYNAGEFTLEIIDNWDS